MSGEEREFLLRGTFIVERDFLVRAKSVDEAINHPERWEEVDEITLKRTGLEVLSDGTEDEDNENDEDDEQFIAHI